MKLIKKEILDKYFERWDLTVEKTHNFIAEGVVVHNTSTKLIWKEDKLSFFAGGCNHEQFVSIFTPRLEELTKLFTEKFAGLTVVIYGEGYGGRMQAMSNTYGKELKFIAFEVKINDNWLDVPNAEQVCQCLNIEFVHYVKTTTDIKELDAQRDAPSVQAIRNGCGNDKIREGIVIRPLIEVIKNNGERIIAKHKGEKFSETTTERKIVDPARLQIISDAELIAQEWVTPNRLSNILSHIQDYKIEDTGKIIGIMIEDIKREGALEIQWNKDVEKIVGRNTAILFKNHLKKVLI